MVPDSKTLTPTYSDYDLGIDILYLWRSFTRRHDHWSRKVPVEEKIFDVD